MARRKHAVIMFTDIVGYMALMDSDKEKAFKMLQADRKLHKHMIAKHHGKLIKEIEDDILASFDLSSDAVRCALEIQRKARAIDVPLTIGIHEGEMIFEGNDVVGDGVNIASRLQEISKEGCITISGSVYNNVKNKQGFSAEFVGEQQLKNVDEPIMVYTVKCYEVGETFTKPEKINGKNRHVIPYIIIILLLIILIITYLWKWLSLPTLDPDQKQQEENKTDTLNSGLLFKTRNNPLS